MTSGRIITDIKYLEVRDVPGDVVHVLTDLTFTPFEVPAEAMWEVPAYVKTEAVRIPESGVAAIRSVREEWQQLFGMEDELRRWRDRYAELQVRMSWMRRDRDAAYNNYRAAKDELGEIKGMNFWERLKWALKPRRSKR